MRKAFAGAVASLLVLVSSVALAQKLSDKETERVFLDYAACTAKARPDDARAVVHSIIPNDEIVHTYPKLVSSACLDGLGLRLAMPGDFLRYGLAHALVRRDYPTGFPADLAAAAPLKHREVIDADYLPKPGRKLKPHQLEALQKRKEKAVAYRLVSLYGECVVRTDPAHAHALILSNPRSAEEAAAFQALAPAFEQCLEEGNTAEFKKLTLRGTIALNFYRLARAPRITAAAK